MSATCSQLSSSTRSSPLRPKASDSRSTAASPGAPAPRVTCITRATALQMLSRSDAVVRSQKRTLPFPWSSACRKARRVLPMPPAPNRVRTRAPNAKRPRSSSSSALRPMKCVCRVGARKAGTSSSIVLGSIFSARAGQASACASSPCGRTRGPVALGRVESRAFSSAVANTPVARRDRVEVVALFQSKFSIFQSPCSRTSCIAPAP